MPWDATLGSVLEKPSCWKRLRVFWNFLRRAFVSWGRPNAWWFQTMAMCVRRPKVRYHVPAGPRSLQGLQGRSPPALSLPASGGSRCPLACGRITPVFASESRGLALRVVSYDDTHCWISGPPHNPRRSHFNILAHICKGDIRRCEWTRLLRGHI